jgi:hypothetical protein
VRPVDRRRRPAARRRELEQQLEELLGERGIALGALTMVFVGNPFSAVGSAPELLPQPVGGIGQLLPPGAGGNLLRSTGFFDGAGAGGHVAVLAA